MIKVFMANRPPLKEYDNQNILSSMQAGEIHRIAEETGNHWRKIFNVYAKFMYSLAINTNDMDILKYKTWQRYRDKMLLQAGSQTQLHFNYADLDVFLALEDPVCIRIVMGKIFADSLFVKDSLTWLDKDFAINEKLGVIVCPYFDYRQLSNVKIDRLVSLVISTVER